jgi:hypothetical protein
VVTCATALLSCAALLPSTAHAAGCVDVEKATAAELNKGLKGVGPALAKRIVAYRKAERTKATKSGRKTWNYRNWLTLMKVDGVSHKVCADNLATVCFGGKAQKACPKPEAVKGSKAKVKAGKAKAKAGKK